MTINKDEIILNWIRNIPDYGSNFLMDWLSENQWACAIIPIAGEANVKIFIDGSAIKQYDFMLQMMMQLSDTTDSVNTDNLYLHRQWQDWLEQQEINENYPDFGDKCNNYQIMNLSNMPQLAQINENMQAKYQFAARIKYMEVK